MAWYQASDATGSPLSSAPCAHDRGHGAPVACRHEGQYGVAPFDPALGDYATKAVTLYRLLVPKLNFDLSTEFRNSAPDNGFELWRLLQRKLDPPRADVEFHLVNDIRKHARTSCANFDQTVRFIAFLESKRREFGVETGTSLDTTVLGEVLGAAMDEDTVGRIEDAGKSIKDYDDCK